VDNPYEVTMKFLEYVYTDDVAPPEDLEQALSLISLAHQFGIERLKDKVTPNIKNKLNSENLLDVLTWSAQYDCRQLYGYCKHMVLADLDNISKTQKFEDLNEILKKNLLV